MFIIKRPIITEKSTNLVAQNKYTFEVEKRANKNQIKEAVEKLFKVKVLDVQTTIVKGKRKRNLKRRWTKRPDWKKAVLTLKSGDKIDLFEKA